MAVSYGYSFAVNPLHFAVIVGGIVNQGISYEPRFLLQDPPTQRHTHMVSAQTSQKINHLLRQVIIHGTGQKARDRWLKGQR